MTPPRDVIAGRHRRVRAILADLGIDAFVAVHVPNVAWLTGFHASAAAALVTMDVVWLVTDRRYAQAAEEAIGSFGGDVALTVVDRSYD